MAKYLKEPEMREFFGWGRDSEMPSVYVHLSGRDVDSSVLSIYGIKEASKKPGTCNYDQTLSNMPGTQRSGFKVL